MPRFLRKAGKLLRVNGKFARDGCASLCCGPVEFYYAVRCDVYSGSQNGSIPPEVPIAILIPVPFQCGTEPCEIDGGRIVVYSGHCYRIAEDQRPGFEYQDPPCENRRRARRLRAADIPPENPYPIVDRSQVTCKNREATCADIDCLPIAPPGSCCAEQQVPDCDDVDPSGLGCTPCSDTLRCVCGNRWYLRIVWNTLIRSWSPRFPPEMNGLLIEELRSSGTLYAEYECVSDGVWRVADHLVAASPIYSRGPDFIGTCGNNDPPLPGTTQAYYDEQVLQLGQHVAQFVYGCGTDPRGIINGVTNIGHVDCAGGGPIGGPFLVQFGGPCAYHYTDENRSMHAGMSASCGGGTCAWNTSFFESDGFVRGINQGEILWTFGTLVRCPDGGQLFQPPPGKITKSGVTAVRITPDIERSIVEQFGV